MSLQSKRSETSRGMQVLREEVLRRLLSPSPPHGTKSRKRRVNITDLLGIQDRYPDTDRAQLNMLAPVPVVLRWRQLVANQQAPAWELLEAAMDALEARQTKSSRKSHNED